MSAIEMAIVRLKRLVPAGMRWPADSKVVAYFYRTGIALPLIVRPLP
jgi:hypothetical protein